MDKKQRLGRLSNNHNFVLNTKLLLFGFLCVIVIDGIWLGIIAKSFYARELAVLSRDLYILWSALMSWIIIVIGVVFLVIPNTKNIKGAVKYGALYGFILYGLYDFTNYAILNNWSLTMTLVDVLWGITICTILSVALFNARKWIGKN
jgi:uncharacterized membrane protein